MRLILTPHYPAQLNVTSSPPFQHDFTAGSVQHTWLSTTLSAVDRKVTPWLILTSHRPMYIDSNYVGPKTDSDVNVM